MGQVRWAVLGGGRVSQSHVRSLAACRDARVVAVMDRHPERVQPLAALAGAEPTGSLDELLARDDVDAATVALPTQQHVEVVARLADHGIHVLCEKPLGSSVDEARAMISACATAGVHLGVILNNRGLVQARWIHDQIRSGRLDVRAVHITVAMAAMPGAPMSTPEFIGAIGVHYLDLVQWWLGPPRQLSSVDSPGAFSVGLGYGSAVADLRMSIGGTTHRGVTVEVVAAEGRITFDTLGRFDADGDLGPLPDVPPAPEGHTFGPGHAVVIDEAATALAAGRPFPVDATAGLAARRLCDLSLVAVAPPVDTIELFTKES